MTFFLPLSGYTSKSLISNSKQKVFYKLVTVDFSSRSGLFSNNSCDLPVTV